MAHRTTNARRSGLFLRPENEHVILGRGTSDRANTRRRWMASSPRPSGTVRPVPGASGPPRTDPLGVGHTLAAWHLLAGDLKTTVTTTAGWDGGWLARHKRLNRPSRGPCTKCGVSAGRAPVNARSPPLGRGGRRRPDEKIAAMPCAPPMHIVTSAYLRPVPRKSYRALTTRMAPVGCPEGDATALRVGPFWQKAEFPHVLGFAVVFLDDRPHRGPAVVVEVVIRVPFCVQVIGNVRRVIGTKVRRRCAMPAGSPRPGRWRRIRRARRGPGRG